MSRKRSQYEQKRLVEEAVATVCGLSRPGLWFCTDVVEVQGCPPELLRVWATLRFLPAGSPFCCGEPLCHLTLLGKGMERVGDHVRRAMGLRQPVAVEFPDNIGAVYHPGIELTFAPGPEPSP